MRVMQRLLIAALAAFMAVTIGTSPALATDRDDLIAEVQGHIDGFTGRNQGAVDRWQTVIDRLNDDSTGITDEQLNSWLDEGTRNGWIRATTTLPKVMTYLASLPRTGAQADAERLNAIVEAVEQMCLHPDRRGEYLEVTGEVNAGVLVRVIGAEIDGQVNRQAWNGFNQRFDRYRTDPRQCAVQILPILLRHFNVQDPGEDLNECVRREVADNLRRPFSVQGGVRCPGRGCFLVSGNCNRRETTLSYAAESDYFIGEHRFVQLGANHASNGRLQTVRDSSGRIIEISIDLTCDPPNYIGAPGGWNNGEFRGTILHGDLEVLQRRTIANCGLRHE